MSCDLCGKSGATFLVRIEGVAYDVCSDCRRHGEQIRTVTPRKRSARVQPDEHLVVRADAAKVLRDARSKSQKTQAEIASLAGVKTSEWQAWESGTRTPTIALARRLEKLLNISLTEQDVVSTTTVSSSPSSQEFTIGDLMKKR